jgi:Starch binding domain
MLISTLQLTNLLICFCLGLSNATENKHLPIESKLGHPPKTGCINYGQGKGDSTESQHSCSEKETSFAADPQQWVGKRFTLSKVLRGWGTTPSSALPSTPSRILPSQFLMSMNTFQILNSSDNVLATTTSATMNPCLFATAVAVVLQVTAATSYGDSLAILGSIDLLGNWNISQRLNLTKAASYSAANPLWSISLTIDRGVNFQYQYVDMHLNGSSTSEAAPKHTHTVPSGVCSETVSVTWQSPIPMTPSYSCKLTYCFQLSS